MITIRNALDVVEDLYILLDDLYDYVGTDMDDFVQKQCVQIKKSLDIIRIRLYKLGYL